MIRIKCLHGYFKFYEDRAGEISRFASLFGLDLVPVEDYYTFEDLEEAPEFAFAGGDFLGSTPTKTFSGDPWDVMRENDLVYDFSSGSIKRIELVTRRIQVVETSNYFVSDGLIVPGSFTEDGERVTDYSAWYIFDSAKFKYTEIVYE